MILDRQRRAVLAALWVVGAAACSSEPQCQPPWGSTDCLDFVQCSYKTGANPGSLNAEFGPCGTCWTSAAQADMCTNTCKAGNTAFKTNGQGLDAGCTFGH